MNDMVTMTAKQLDAMGDKMMDRGFEIACAIINDLSDTYDSSLLLGDVVRWRAGLITAEQIRRHPSSRK